MDMLVIRGGQTIRGAVRAGGAKNAALPIMAASLLTDGNVCLKRVPRLADVSTLSQLLQSLGMTIEPAGDESITLTVHDRSSFTAPYDLVRRMRASICVLGPLLARRGRARVSLPGGCNIGHRPIDLHLKGLQALGANIRVEGGYVLASARKLKGNVIDLRGPFGATVTGTCNVMAAAVLADGTTTITHAAMEPEVVDLACFLNGLGARITGHGTPVIQIDGVSALHEGTHTVIPDRIEAATLLIAAIAARGEVTAYGLIPDHLSTVIETLRAAGAVIEMGRDSVSVGPPALLRPLHVEAQPYPGTPTDVQAQLTALLATVSGISVVTDRVFPGRFMHISELCRMGAVIEQRGDNVLIHGGRRLSGASVMASDLRASAALVIAALSAEGETTIRRVYHLDRGYEFLDRKLNDLGASILRLKDTSEETLRVPVDAPARAA